MEWLSFGFAVKVEEMALILLNVGLAAIPSLLIILYVYRKDRGDREPPMLVFAAFIFGFFAVVPAVIVELVFTELTSHITGLAYVVVRAFVVAALVEESAKLAVVRIFLYRKDAFDEFSDGMLYTITASLGFAFFENILYSFGPPYVLIIRGITAVPLHATASGVLGYYIGMSKHTGRNRIIAGLLWAVLIHGLYDFFLFSGNLLALLVIPLLVATTLILRRLFRLARRYDLQRETGGK